MSFAAAHWSSSTTAPQVCMVKAMLVCPSIRETGLRSTPAAWARGAARKVPCTAQSRCEREGGFGQTAVEGVEQSGDLRSASYEGICQSVEVGIGRERQIRDEVEWAEGLFGPSCQRGNVGNSIAACGGWNLFLILGAVVAGGGEKSGSAHQAGEAQLAMLGSPGIAKERRLAAADGGEQGVGRQAGFQGQVTYLALGHQQQRVDDFDRAAELADQCIELVEDPRVCRSG
jgi:hypothetical protein